MKKPTIEEYVNALEKMKNNPNDRLGLLGELGITGIGITAGAAASGTIAATAGVATLAGSSTLASILGGIFVTTTPVGWVVGTVVAGGTLAYTASKLVRSGSKSDTLRKISIEEIEKRIKVMRQEAQATLEYNDKISNIITSIQHLVNNSHLNQDKGIDILKAIEMKALGVDEAFELLQNIINEKK